MIPITWALAGAIYCVATEVFIQNKSQFVKIVDVNFCGAVKLTVVHVLQSDQFIDAYDSTMIIYSVLITLMATRCM